MFVTLDAPYADTTAADLAFALGLPELPALHVLDLTLAPGTELRLRLLGASHQVVLRTSERELVETVACLPGRPAELPPAIDEQAFGYRFASRIRRLSPHEMRASVARLRAQLADDPHALVGVFPGSPEAVTALRAHGAEGPPAQVGWRTWHAYPQSGELVETETGVVLR